MDKSTGSMVSATNRVNDDANYKIVNTVISPSVYELIARRALLNHSGDIRKLACMCKLIVQVANADSARCEHDVNSHRSNSSNS